MREVRNIMWCFITPDNTPHNKVHTTLPLLSLMRNSPPPFAPFKWCVVDGMLRLRYLRLRGQSWRPLCLRSVTRRKVIQSPPKITLIRN